MENYTIDNERTLPKVLHIALIHGGGGVEAYVKMMLHHTADCFENILVCSSDFTEDIGENTKRYNVDVPREISVKSDLSAARRIRKIIRQEKPDVIYCHSSMAGAVGRVAAIGLGRKVLYNPHGWSFDMKGSGKKAFLFAVIERILGLFTTEIITISNYEKHRALEKKICNPKKTCVILNGIELQLPQKIVSRKDIGFADEDFLVACCGRISQQKDPMLFAEVAGEIAKKCPRARFLWIGDGEDRAALEEKLRVCGVFDKTYITGMVSDSRAYMGAADVCVLFSQWEGFGLVLAEYMLMGKPVVATDVGAISEVVENGVSGTLIADRKADMLADAVLQYLNKDRYGKTADQARIRAKAFDICATARHTEELINRILGR